MPPNEPEAGSVNTGSATWLSAYGYGDGHPGDTQLTSTPRYSSNKGTQPVLHVPQVPEPDLPTGTLPDLEADLLMLPAEGQFFDFQMENTTPDDQTMSATPEIPPLGTSAGLEATSSCSCALAPKWMCRLKKLNTELRTENETMRSALAGMRQTLDMQYDLLQDIEDKNMLPGDMMERLWAYQDKMRTFVGVRFI
jgi:hypothetical protein